MKLLIAGSRGFDDYLLLCQVIEQLFKNEKIECIISGGARGADTLGEKYAKEHNIRVERYLPDWNAYGKSAGIRRNKIMCQKADVLLAFWDDESRGTKFTINYMENLGKPQYTVHYMQKV